MDIRAIRLPGGWRPGRQPIWKLADAFRAAEGPEAFGGRHLYWRLLCGGRRWGLVLLTTGPEGEQVQDGGRATAPELDEGWPAGGGDDNGSA